MNLRRCFIHIGAPKTGTTWLQKFLFENRDDLARLGFLYPDISLRGFGHHDIAFQLSGGYPEWATSQSKGLPELARDLKALADRKSSLILSSENFFLFPRPVELRDFLADAGVLEDRELVIIAYVRRQDEAHESWYNQTIKAQGSTLTIEECVSASDGLWDYNGQLDLWASVFGDDAITIRVYDADDTRGDWLLRDFFAILGAPLDGFANAREVVNSGLNRDILEFQRMVNRLPGPISEKRKHHKQLIELTARAARLHLFDETPLLGKRRRIEILDRYRDGNTAVARRFLGRERLFSETFDALLPDVVRPPELSLESMTYILGWLMMHHA